MEKAICPACKAEIEDDSKFCPECGTNIEELKETEELKKAEEVSNAEESKKVLSEKKFCINCGVKLDADAVFCPECGTKIESIMEDTKSEIIKNTVSDEVENNIIIEKSNDLSQPDVLYEKKSEPQGINNGNELGTRKRKIAFGIATAIPVLLVFGLAISGGIKFVQYIYHNVKTEVENSKQTSSYAKIKSEFMDVVEDDYMYNLLLNTNFLGMLVAGNKWNSNDKKAVKDACDYVRKNENLQNYGVYCVELYKHYYSENDKDGWMIFLRYSRRDDDFSAALVRF